MLVLFAKPKYPVEIGIGLKAGQKGYIFIVNKRGDFCLFDTFHARVDGYYRSHNFMLEDDFDFATVFGLVMAEPLDVYERSRIHQFLWRGADVDAILAPALDYQPHVATSLIEVSKTAVVSKYRQLNQAYTVVENIRRGVENHTIG